MDSEAMDTAGIIISPSTHQKIKSRNAAMRLKHGVPQFKDVLRKRFCNRIKENRGRLFDRLRNMDISHKSNVSRFIQNELSTIISSEDLYLIDPDEEACIRDELELEALSEQGNWLMQQYDMLMAEDYKLQQLWEENQRVVCPVCRKGNLKISSSISCDNAIFCDFCHMSVPARASIQDIQDRIYVIMNNHSETGCNDDVLFFVSQEDASLYAHCNRCPFLDLAV